MLHYRLQLLTECHRHLRHALASLVKSCLHRSILHIKLIRYRCTLSKRLRRFLLLPPHHIEVASKRRYHLRSTSTILAHILEHWSQHINIAQFVKTIQQHKKSLVSALLQRFVELLRIKTRSLDDFVVLLEHIHNDFGNRRCRHLHRLSLAIQHRSEAHYFRNSHLRLGTHASHALCEVGEIRSRSRAVLRQLINHRTHGKQSLLRAEAFLVTEDVGKFTQCKRSTITEVVQSHIDLVGSFHESQDILLRCFAQSTRFLRQLIQFLTTRSGVNLLEVLIQLLHLRSVHSGKLAHIRHLLVHIRKSVHRRASCHDDTRDGSSNAGKSCLPVVQLSVHPFPQTLILSQLRVHFGNLCLNTLNRLTLSVPLFASTFKPIKVTLQL